MTKLSTDANQDLLILLKDMYKAFHPSAYKPGTTHVYANLTNRFGKHSNIKGNTSVMSVGQQAYVKQFLIRRFSMFFNTPLPEVVSEYQRIVGSTLGKEVGTHHIEELHKLGYVPLRVKAIKEGTMVPYGVPTMTIMNTVSGFGWVVNMLETLMSAEIWPVQTAATTAFEYKKNFLSMAKRTGFDKDMIPFMGHDFSFRGMPGVGAASLTGFGHLTSFVGSDTIPAGLFAERYYGVEFGKDLIMASVDATEHSVMCSYGNEGEVDSIEHLMTEVSPTGVLSVVCDTWDFWKVVTEYLPQLKDKIMQRDGTLVIRPDSGDPVDILCGTGSSAKTIEGDYTPEQKGLVECLWDIFGGTTTEKGYKLLDSHIGAIYGDSITIERQLEIHRRLEAKGFVPSVVLGIGSFTYQYVTRDTHGSAVKATAIKLNNGDWQGIFKQPKTDANKNSAKGLMKVQFNGDGILECLQGVSEEEEGEGELRTIFFDGDIYNETTLTEIRSVVESQIVNLS
jgi:nicotinamide phosphoribosyltransferase